MKIIYDEKQHLYLVEPEYPETELWINTDDIATARDVFLEHMKNVFNDTVREKLKDDVLKCVEGIKPLT